MLGPQVGLPTQSPFQIRYAKTYRFPWSMVTTGPLWISITSSPSGAHSVYMAFCPHATTVLPLGSLWTPPRPALIIRCGWFHSLISFTVMATGSTSISMARVQCFLDFGQKLLCKSALSSMVMRFLPEMGSAFNISFQICVRAYPKREPGADRQR